MAASAPVALQNTHMYLVDLMDPKAFKDPLFEATHPDKISKQLISEIYQWRSKVRSGAYQVVEAYFDIGDQSDFIWYNIIVHDNIEYISRTTFPMYEKASDRGLYLYLRLEELERVTNKSLLSIRPPSYVRVRQRSLTLTYKTSFRSNNARQYQGKINIIEANNNDRDDLKQQSNNEDDDDVIMSNDNGDNYDHDDDNDDDDDINDVHKNDHDDDDINDVHKNDDDDDDKNDVHKNDHGDDDKNDEEDDDDMCWINVNKQMDDETRDKADYICKWIDRKYDWIKSKHMIQYYAYFIIKTGLYGFYGNDHIQNLEPYIRRMVYAESYHGDVKDLIHKRNGQSLDCIYIYIYIYLSYTHRTYIYNQQYQHQHTKMWYN